MARPKQIIVIRHAEKPTSDDDQRLSSIGFKRADYIAKYIPETFGIPDYIFATAVTKSSARPALTVLPLWEPQRYALLDLSVDDEAAFHLAHHIVHDGHWDNQNVLVCWHHGKIPDLLKGLGAKKHEYPDPWPEDDFDTVFKVTFDHGEPVVSTYKMNFNG